MPLHEAEGCVLAHTIRLHGRVLHKGSILDAGATAALGAAGYGRIIAARLDPGDVAEDEAAWRLAQALLAPEACRNLAPGRPATGRVNLAASCFGLFRADPARIDAMNAVHEAITIATLPDATPVSPGELVATVKIIPFAVPGAALARALRLATDMAALRLPGFRPLRTGLIMTQLPGTKPSVLASTARVTRERIERLGGTLLPPITVPHDTTSVAGALRTLLPEAELVLIAGASAVMDRNDVAPAAIVAAGGASGGMIEHFGMPVDPGNLICVGSAGGIPALVLPGCARSPKLNGIDFVLHRLFAGEPAGGAEITRMGVGGLLKEFSTRPMPRQGAASAPHTEERRIAAVVLAAGLSSRMAPANKLLVTDVTGTAMIARVVDGILASRARPVSVVVGHQADAVRQALGARPVSFVQSPDFASGMAASLRAGVAAVQESASAALICLGDMPLVGPGLLDRLIDAYDPDEGRLIIVPTCRGKRGNPILWDRRFFADMNRLTGDAGARSLLGTHAEAVAEVNIEDEAILLDYDRPGGLPLDPAGAWMPQTPPPRNSTR